MPVYMRLNHRAVSRQLGKSRRSESAEFLEIAHSQRREQQEFVQQQQQQQQYMPQQQQSAFDQTQSMQTNPADDLVQAASPSSVQQGTVPPVIPFMPHGVVSQQMIAALRTHRQENRASFANRLSHPPHQDKPKNVQLLEAESESKSETESEVETESEIEIDAENESEFESESD
jgi:hypothetical protein